MEICLKTEKKLISNDCNTMCILCNNIHDGVFALMVIPFYAISIRALEEYWNIEFINPESNSKIYDLRNSLKIYQDKFRKIKIRFLEVDKASDEYFKNLLNFENLKELNIHHNLGIYVTKEGKIIGNTQWIESYIKMYDVPEEEIAKQAIFMGYMMSQSIKKACIKNDPYFELNQIELGRLPQLGYLDLNTNTSEYFFCGSWDKEVHLAFLHILSLINFEKYILENILPHDNEWLFRIKYVVTHYAISGIELIYRHCNADNTMEDNIKEHFLNIIQNRWTIFSSDFRNCMMHYRLTDMENRPLIKEELFDESKTFNGLIESNFSGISFEEYDNILSKKRNEIESFLEKQFLIDKKDIMYD